MFGNKEISLTQYLPLPSDQLTCVKYEEVVKTVRADKVCCETVSPSEQQDKTAIHNGQQQITHMNPQDQLFKLQHVEIKYYADYSINV